MLFFVDFYFENNINDKIVKPLNYWKGLAGIINGQQCLQAYAINGLVLDGALNIW